MLTTNVEIGDVKRQTLYVSDAADDRLRFGDEADDRP